MNTLTQYLEEIRRARSLGSVPETSYYLALSGLMNTIGLSLSPKVRCVVHPKSQGAGIPDLALFSVDQTPASGEPQPGVIPSRGVIEAKGATEDVDKIAVGRQVPRAVRASFRHQPARILQVTRDGLGERFKLVAVNSSDAMPSPARASSRLSSRE